MNRERRVFEFGDFRLDAPECTLTRNQRTIPLEPQVFQTLLVLVANAGHLVEKSRFFDEVWSGTVVEEGNLVRNISLLRKALGEASGGERYIETVPKRGYRFVARVRKIDSESVDSRVKVAGKRQSVSPSRKKASIPRGRGLPYLVAAVIAGLLLVVVLTPWTGIITTDPPGGDVQTSIAVLPFQPGDDQDEALARGMTEALIDKLSMIPQLSVRPLGVVRRYGASDREPLEIGREMGVEAVLESTLQQKSGEVLVLAQLLRVKDGMPLWSFRSAQPQSELLNLQDRLSEKVAGSLVAQLSTEERRLLRRQYTQSPEAYQLYLKGRYFFDKITPDGVKKSISYFEEAIDKDPDYALAYAGICASYTLFGHLRVLRPREVYPAAKAALARALELDDSLSEAHAQQGFISLHYDYDWGLAGESFQRAIELNPYSSMAHHGRAMYLATVKRMDEGVLVMQQALELDPASLNLNADLGLLLHFARRHEDAIKQLEGTLEMQPGYPLAVLYLARIYGHLQQEKLAFDHYQRWAQVHGHATPVESELSARAFAASGISGYYRLEISRLEKMSTKRYVPPFDYARFYAALGDPASTIEWLERALEDRSFAIPFLNVDPGFDKVRSDPRFSEFTQRIRLP